MLEPQQPAGTTPTPFVPKSIDPLVFEEFNGVNTMTTRAGVDDKEAYWLDGFMPLGPRRHLRPMYGIGASIFSPSVGISLFNFANIGSTPYKISILNDGSVWVVNTLTLVQTEIANAGTIQSPGQLNAAINQWGSQFVQIVANQTNGYYLWDGTTFYPPGGVGPTITVTNGGSGFTSAPTVTFSGGGGSGAAATATIANGVIISIQITNAGTGFTSAPTIGFTGGGGS